MFAVNAKLVNDHYSASPKGEKLEGPLRKQSRIVEGLLPVNSQTTYRTVLGDSSTSP